MSEKTFLHIPISKDLMKRIDDYRFNRRFQTRAEAVRFLLEWALKQNPKPDKPGH